MTGVHLTGFGLAKSTATGSRHTGTGQALGTPAYMSPEQAQGETAALTPATDVWSLGCVLYQLLAGRRAFEGNSAAEVIGAVLTREAPDLRAIRPNLPVAVARVVARCLAKPAAGRYPDARALADDLARVSRGEAPAPIPWSRPSRGPMPVAALLLVAGALAVVVAASVLSTPDSAPAGARALADEARTWQQSDPGRAAAGLRRALALAPDQHGWRVEHGVQCWAAGDGAAALREWALVPASAPDSATARLYAGLEAFFRLDASEATRRVSALRETPGTAGQMARAVCAAAGRDWEEAREELRGAEGWSAALLRGYVDGAAYPADWAAAEQAFSTALAEGIPFAWAFVHRGVARAAQGNHTDAIADYDRGLQLAPGIRDAYTHRGRSRQGLGDLAGAIEDHERELARDPRHVVARNNRGLARLDLGDAPSAVADFTAVLELDPDFASALHHRGLARGRLGELAGALADLTRAIGLRPGHPGQFLSRSTVRQRMGDASGALEDLDQALALEPDHVQALGNRGALRRAVGDAAGARADLDRALELDPDDVLTRYHRGVLRVSGTDLTGGIADLERALRDATAAFPARAEAEACLARARTAAAGSR